MLRVSALLKKKKPGFSRLLRLKKSRLIHI